jgi:uncharacterized lipoprotein YddW (UPF0748 family)
MKSTKLKHLILMGRMKEVKKSHKVSLFTSRTRIDVNRVTVPTGYKFNSNRQNWQDWIETNDIDRLY